MTQQGTQGYILTTPGVRHTQISGSFQPNGTGALTNVYGIGFSVVRTSAGVYTVTLTRPFANIVSACANKTTDEVTNHNIVFGAITLPTGTTNGSFTLTHLVSGTAADITASGALRRVNFQVVLANGKVPGSGV